MNLAIDIGNTLQKIAVFSNDDCVLTKSLPLINEEVLEEIFQQFSIKNSIVSSVAELDTQIIELLKSNTQLLLYSHETKLPIKNRYSSVETLGLDRIANAVGAVALFPKKNVLSIQAGTCIVLDFVNKKGEYLGGSISPGIQMRFDLLHKKTKKLPQIAAQHPPRVLLGTDTESSIICGALNGICYEIDGFIDDYRTEYEDIIVLFTGGDSPYLQKLIKNTIFAAPNLVLKGLNEIIKHNV